MFDLELFNAHMLMLRKKNDLSQEQFGNIINLSKQAINNIEKGRSKFSIEKLVLLADYFNTSTDYLLCRTDNPQQSDEALSTLPENEKALLSSYRTLSDFDRKKLLEYMELLQAAHRKD